MANSTDPKPRLFKPELFRKELPEMAAQLVVLMDQGLANMTTEDVESGKTCGVDIGLSNPDGAPLKITLLLQYITDEEVEEAKAMARAQAEEDNHGRPD